MTVHSVLERFQEGLNVERSRDFHEDAHVVQSGPRIKLALETHVFLMKRQGILTEIIPASQQRLLNLGSRVDCTMKTHPAPFPRRRSGQNRPPSPFGDIEAISECSAVATLNRLSSQFQILPPSPPSAHSRYPSARWAHPVATLLLPATS